MSRCTTHVRHILIVKIPNVTSEKLEGAPASPSSMELLAVQCEKMNLNGCRMQRTRGIRVVYMSPSDLLLNICL
jgi:hypothetical protein